MDEIFGGENFINEVIWHYKSGGASRGVLPENMILYYSIQSQSYYFLTQKSYNRVINHIGLRSEEYRDEFGWYTMVNRKDVWILDMVGKTSAERAGYVLKARL